MLKHIVLFSLVDFDTPELRHEQLQLIKRELEALPELIPSLDALSVHFNENPAEDYDLLLEALVQDLSALESYAQHPEHLRVARECIKPYLKARACVDYPC